jgi:hypothetical protein
LKEERRVEIFKHYIKRLGEKEDGEKLKSEKKNNNKKR